MGGGIVLVLVEEGRRACNVGSAFSSAKRYRHIQARKEGDRPLLLALRQNIKRANRRAGPEGRPGKQKGEPAPTFCPLR